MTHRQTQVAMRGARWVDPQALARIQSLELLARTVVDGFINGLHRAPHLGFSLDFAEHRAYEPGDDLRRVDWRLFARTDRYFVKQFEADSNANCVVALDVSTSMRYGRGGISKLDYGRFLAASLLYFSHTQRDRLGLVTFDRKVIEYVPASARHLEYALTALDRIGAPRPGSLAGPLLTATERLHRRGIVVVISDLYEEPDAVASAIKPLRFRGHDVIVFHLLDPSELDFPFTESASFEDVESGERMAGRARMRSATSTGRWSAISIAAALERLFTDSRIDYALFDTSVPLDLALFRYLSTRERLRRVR